MHEFQLKQSIVPFSSCSKSIFRLPFTDPVNNATFIESPNKAIKLSACCSAKISVDSHQIDVVHL